MVKTRSNMTQLEQAIETIKDWERDIRFPNDDREAIRKDTLCEVLDYLTSLPSLRSRQNVEWSEEDDIIIDGIIANLEYLLCNTVLVQSTKENIEARLRWLKRLKSLRSRPKSSDNWKPCEEQMKVLKLVADKDGTCLQSLYDDLKKLM